ncbi:unnamed protein product [Moneuplotes crassus]|uniref:Uncharacterized protein n=1 Tax=Euplotes crassus TaxID=5936 RepID=A0AAD1XPW0_EUPCR|nr:unnamed protein product [Moneuplotes crassus]
MRNLGLKMASLNERNKFRASSQASNKKTREIRIDLSNARRYDNEIKKELVEREESFIPEFIPKSTVNLVNKNKVIKIPKNAHKRCTKRRSLAENKKRTEKSFKKAVKFMPDNYKCNMGEVKTKSISRYLLKSKSNFFNVAENRAVRQSFINGRSIYSDSKPIGSEYSVKKGTSPCCCYVYGENTAIDTERAPHNHPFRRPRQAFKN